MQKGIFKALILEDICPEDSSVIGLAKLGIHNSFPEEFPPASFPYRKAPFKGVNRNEMMNCLMVFFHQLGKKLLFKLAYLLNQH